MKSIKIKLPFDKQTEKERLKKLLEYAKIFAGNKFFTVVEVKHYSKMSYMIIFLSQKKQKVSDNYSVQ